MMFLFKETYLIHIVASLILNSRPKNLDLSKAYLQYIFSVRHITVFLCLGSSLDSTSAFYASMLNSKTINKSTKMHKKIIMLNRLQRMLVCNVKAESGRQSVTLVNLPETCTGKPTFF